MTRDEMRARLEGARVARMATVTPEGMPHVVPVVFVLVGDTLYWEVDRKPKRSPEIKRLANIEANPNVEVIVDHYEEDWGALWWVRVSGPARILRGGSERTRALDGLIGKYPQYRSQRPDGPAVAVDIERWSSWNGFTAGPAPDEAAEG